MSAFSQFRTPDEKTFRLVRPMFYAPASVQPAVEMRVNYSTDAINDTIPTTELSGTAWDEGLWDVASWGDAPEPSFEWRCVDERGFVGAYRFAGSAEGASITLNQTDVRYEVGSAL